MRAAPAGVLIRLLLVAQFATTAAFVLSPPAGATSHVLVSAVQDDPPDDKDNEVNPTRLWELYPLNPNRSRDVNPTPSPEASATPSPQPSPTASPEPTSSAAPATGTFERDTGSSVGRAQDQQTTEETPTGLPPLAWGVVLVSLLGVFIVVSRLISTLRSVPAQRSRSGIVGSSAQLSKSHQPKPEDEGSKLVRIELVDGRAVEGWQKATSEGKSSVLVLDVVATYDEKGATMPISVTDSFILSSTVREVRDLDESRKGQGD